MLFNRYSVIILSGVCMAILLSSCQVKKAEDILAEVNSKIVASKMDMNLDENFSHEKKFAFDPSSFASSPFFTGRLNGFSNFIDEKSFNKKIDYPVGDKYLSPLSLVDLSKITLIGTILSGQEKLALVEYAKKVFFIRKGDRLGKGDGRVTFIGDEVMHVYQQKDDGTGKIANERVIIRTSVTKEDGSVSRG